MVNTYSGTAVGAVVVSIGGNEVAIETLRWVESHVVVVGGVVLTEAELSAGGEQQALLLLNQMKQRS